MQSRKIVPFCAGREQNYFVYGNDGEATFHERPSVGIRGRQTRRLEGRTSPRGSRRKWPGWLLFIGHPTTEAADKRRCRHDLCERLHTGSLPATATVPGSLTSIGVCSIAPAASRGRPSLGILTSRRYAGRFRRRGRKSQSRAQRSNICNILTFGNETVINI
jgi:hypothetical protein